MNESLAPQSEPAAVCAANIGDLENCNKSGNYLGALGYNPK